ncbi:hypothetical protein M4I21_05080 [Cellulophaga sp. 20_2_10]|uniref:hypothetical protein n=1 Tax=Cellulophaga sp. 20_2_10 TaxID=2942476 RepID=UPI00201A9D23|nr:hypothetical protein [Cellulophaga sp. 20_2_10]MCL5245171.1 hypothetical protein [Cellulophaga sp. 20_2_10]
MKSNKPQIKPFNSKEIERIDSGIVTDYVTIIFFGILALVFSYLMVFGIFKSKDVYSVIVYLAIIVVIWVITVYNLKPFVTNIKESQLLLQKNQKFCNYGHIEKKRSVYKRLTIKSMSSNFYISIDGKEYEVGKQSFDDVQEGDYVYYEVKPPLYTEVNKV